MKRYFFSQIRRQKYLLIVGDFIVITYSLFIAYVINFAFFTRRAFTLSRIFQRAIPLAGIVVFFLFVFYLADLYEKDKIRDLFKALSTIVVCVLLVSLVSSGILFFFTKYIIGRKVIVINIPIITGLLIIWRFIFLNIIRKSERPLRLALIGSMKIIPNFVKEFYRLKTTDYRITQICLIGMSREAKALIPDNLPGSILLYEKIDDLLENEDFDILVYDYTRGEMSKKEIHRILQFKFKGKFIYDFPSFYEDLTGKVSLDFIDSRWLLSDAGFQGKISKNYLRIKRWLDFVFSTILLILTFPLALLIAVAIKIDSKGSIIFSQSRLGVRKRSFICYKFRTMKSGAEEETGPAWSSKDDPRVTRVGKILRRTRLDELPQFWNIIKGEMSFVGNRPIRKYFADELAEMIPYYDLRFLVKPGLSGWAQVSGGYSGSKREQYEKFQYELFYIRRMSLLLDLFIFFKTIKTVILRKGE